MELKNGKLLVMKLKSGMKMTPKYIRIEHDNGEKEFMFNGLHELTEEDGEEFDRLVICNVDTLNLDKLKNCLWSIAKDEDYNNKYAFIRLDNDYGLCVIEEIMPVLNKKMEEPFSNDLLKVMLRLDLKDIEKENIKLIKKNNRIKGLLKSYNMVNLDTIDDYKIFLEVKQEHLNNIIELNNKMIDSIKNMLK